MKTLLLNINKSSKTLLTMLYIAMATGWVSLIIEVFKYYIN